MKSHFVQLAAACFISLLLINHASALPTNSRNRILAREDNDGLTKSLYHRSTDGHIETNINSLTIRAPVGGDEHRTPKAKVPRTSPAPKGREDGEPGKRARTGKKQKDDATDLQDVRKLLDTMIAAQEDEAQGNVEQKKTMPWNDDNRWPDGLVWAAIAELFERRERYFTATHVKQRDRPNDIQLKDEMERSELNTELDKLWLWAVERKRSAIVIGKGKRQTRTHEDLEHYINSHQDDDVSPTNGEKLVNLLLQSGYDTLDMAKMPWNSAKQETLNWNDSLTMTSLQYIWSQMNKNNQSKLPNPVQQLIYLDDSELRPKGMDDAWKWWVEYRAARNRHAAKNKRKAAEAKLEGLEKGCKVKYKDFIEAARPTASR